MNQQSLRQGYSISGPQATSGPRATSVRPADAFRNKMKIENNLKTSIRETFKQFQMVNISVKEAILLCTQLKFEHFHEHIEEYIKCPLPTEGIDDTLSGQDSP